MFAFHCNRIGDFYKNQREVTRPKANADAHNLSRSSLDVKKCNCKLRHDKNLFIRSMFLSSFISRISTEIMRNFFGFRSNKTFIILSPNFRNSGITEKTFVSASICRHLISQMLQNSTNSSDFVFKINNITSIKLLFISATLLPRCIAAV